MMVENKQGVVRPMRKAPKEFGRASYRAIARQLVRNVELGEVLSVRNAGGGVDAGETAGIDGSAGIVTAYLLNTISAKVCGRNDVTLLSEYQRKVLEGMNDHRWTEVYRSFAEKRRLGSQPQPTTLKFPMRRHRNLPIREVGPMP